MAPPSIEPATFRFVVQHLNHCATAVPLLYITMWNIKYVFNYKITHVRRWADKFCLHTNVRIYIRRTCIWIKPVLCSRMVSHFHHTSPRTHSCLLSSPSAHRNGRVFRPSVQTACCYWIVNRGKSSSNWNSHTNTSRLWWSVCWCGYSKTVGKVKCAVREWFVVISVLMWVQ